MLDLSKMLEALDEPQKSYYKALFCHIMSSSAEQFLFLELPPGGVLLNRGDPSERIYFLLDGKIKAFDHQSSGAVYSWAEFVAPNLFGEVEAFCDGEFYRTSLVAKTHCRLLSMPRLFYMDWIRHDVDALFMRVNMITRQLIGQASRERRFLFLSAVERMCIYLALQYEKAGGAARCVLRATRQEIADETGFTIKTVNRSIQKLQNDGFVTVERGKVAITPAQYQLLVSFAGQYEDEGLYI